MEKIYLIICFLMVYGLGKADAFPGEPFQKYSLEYGNPSNLTASPLQHLSERLEQYYWQGTDADPLFIGKKLKGNLIVLFEKQGVKNSDLQKGAGVKLISRQETFLAQITVDDFETVLMGLTGKWKIVSKSTHQNPGRTYDLYQLVSDNQRYLAEISYSPLEAIVSPPSRPADLQTPLYNLWIRITLK